MATSEALERRKDGLRCFASIFRQVAHAREGGWSTDLPRFHLRENVSRDGGELSAQIADAPAPFWRHVRDAVQASDDTSDYFNVKRADVAARKPSRRQRALPQARGRLARREG
jgi:hypothetical protein